MSIFQVSREEKGSQLLFRDDGSFLMRKLLIEDGFLLEKDSNGISRRAWMQFYKLLKEYPGYSFVKIGADMITVSFNRDVLFDPFGQLNTDEKPTMGQDLKKSFVTKIADAKCYRHEVNAKPNNHMDKITTYLGVVVIMLVIAVLIKVALMNVGL